MVNAIDKILILTALFGIIYTLIESLILIIERRHAPKRLSANSNLPPITIFKPLKGLDNQLESNLRSFFELDYPVYELIFGVNDYDDPSLALVKKLQRTYPQVPSRLVVSGFHFGQNPKINNLYNMYPYAKHDHLVISDSNIRVAADYLKRMIATMTTGKVGLVTSIIRGTDTTSIVSLLENLHLNTFIAGNVFAIKRLLGINITIGKSMLFCRETLKSIGGFQALAGYLAEDHLLGQKISELGMEIRICACSINAVNSGWTLRQFINRHLRWATMRRHVNIWHYSAEILSNPVVFALFYLSINPNYNGLGIFVSIYLVKAFLDLVAARSMHAYERWYCYLLTPVKDLIIAGIWTIPFFIYTVNWRGNHFIVSEKTQLSPLLQNQAAFGWSIGNAYFTAFRNKNSIDNLSPLQRLFWFTGMAGKSMINDTRRLIARLGNT